KPKSALWKPATRLQKLRAFVDPALHERADFFELRLRVDRADVGIFVERIADTQRRDAVAQLAEHERKNVLLHQQARAGAANVTLIEKDAADRALDRLINRRIIANDIRRLPAKFERQFFL